MSSPDKTTTAVHGEQGGIIITRVRERALTTSPKPDRPEVGRARVAAQVSLWQLNLLRVGYLVIGGGLAVVKWPLLFNHGPWELKAGTVECVLVAMSVLALMGLRYPLRMLPHPAVRSRVEADLARGRRSAAVVGQQQARRRHP